MLLAGWKLTSPILRWSFFTFPNSTYKADVRSYCSGSETIPPTAPHSYAELSQPRNHSGTLQPVKYGIVQPRECQIHWNSCSNDTEEDALLPMTYA
jgi:hypothetical protein